MYSIFVQLFEPFTFLSILTMTGLFVLWRTADVPRRWLKCFTVFFLLLMLASTPAIAHVAFCSLEWPYGPKDAVADEAAAIVVLGGALLSSDEGTTFDLPAFDTLSRCLKAAKLYHAGPKRLIVVSGGKVDRSTAGPPLAQVMRKALLDRRVEDADIELEDSSTSTYENALETGRLLKSRGIERIALVTEAAHLRRARLCFQKQGFEVDAVGCNYRTTNKQWSILDFLPSAQAAAQVNVAAHEWLGMIWYRIHGRI
jgi:uncharacterized SAM-binding protein YcdF (DUF218 family)